MAESVDEGCILTGSCKDDFLIVLSHQGLVQEEEREVGGMPHCHPCSEEKKAVGSSSWPPADLLGHSRPIRREMVLPSEGLGVSRSLSQLEGMALWPQPARGDGSGLPLSWS